MPPRFAYWTILAGGLPTSFRSADQDELMPTFRRLKEKHPDAVMKYFARGQLWDSAEDARRALRPDDRGKDRRAGDRPPREVRGRDWRPGGQHRDPRQPFKDAQRERNQDRRQQRWSRKQDDRRPAGPPAKPHGDPLAPRPDGRAAPKGFRQDHARRPPGGQPRDWRGKPPGAPKAKWSGSPGHSRGRAAGPRADRPTGKAGERDGRPSKPHGDPMRDRTRPGGFRKSNERRSGRRHDGPSRPPRPDREPPPGRDPKPGPPPRPSEPAIKPPGPPERGTEPGRRRRSED